MKKVDITIFKNTRLKQNCVLCEREIYDDYYDINIDYEDDSLSSGRYRHLCNLCHCALKKLFTGVD